MSDLWGAVPQVRRLGGRAEVPTIEQPAEPSVTANVAGAGVQKQSELAVPTDPRSPSSSDAFTPSSPIDTGSIQTSVAVNPPANRPDDGDVERAAPENGLAPDDAIDTTDPQSVFADTSVEQIERLKAALDDDAERANSPPRAVAGGHDVRVRVESMLARARQLFDLGQTREARHTAKIAHDLGDSARLDYSPDEERPIDLVQRIDDHLRVTAEQAAVQHGNAPDSLANQPVAEPEPAESVIPNGREDKAADPESAKQRRDWGYGLTVFRRDRKPGVTDRANVAPGPATTLPAVTPIPAVVLVPPELDTETDGAVVQANRSLSLAKVEETTPTRQARDASAPIAFAPYQRRKVSSELSDSVQDDSSSETDPEIETQDIGALDQAWPPEITDKSAIAEEEEVIVAPVEFEEVKPLTPFRDVAAAALSDVSEVEQIERPQQSFGWIAGAAVFGICAAIAIFWYRRGAT